MLWLLPVFGLDADARSGRRGRAVAYCRKEVIL